MVEASLWELLVGQNCPGGASESVWGWLIYPSVMLYCFYLLARICDDHLTKALECIVERLKLSEDVAGATFLAGASSAPELFTSIISTCILHNASGLGSIVGSAVFNLLVSIGLSSLFSGQESLDIWWYPTVRDAIWYGIAILEVFLVMLDGLVYWWEGLIMTLSYGLYVFYFTQNERIMRKFGLAPPGKEKAIEGGGEVSDSKRAGSIRVAEVYITVTPPIEWGHMGNEAPPESTVGSVSGTPTEALVCSEACDSQTHSWPGSPPTPVQDKEGEIGSKRDRFLSGQAEASKERAPSKSAVRGKPKKAAKKAPKKSNAPGDARSSTRDGAAVGALLSDSAFSNPSSSSNSGRSAKQRAAQSERKPAQADVEEFAMPTTPTGEKAVEDSEAPPDEVAECPKPQAPEEPFKGSIAEGCVLAKAPDGDVVEGRALPKAPDEDKPAGWCNHDPIMMLVDLVTPARPEWLITWFVLSCLWISVFTYFAVDASTRFGCLLSLDDEVMGLLVLAAGTSVPDAVCSIVVAREGKGDMAVANSVGSNIFDILLCLGLPWLLFAATQGQPIAVPRQNIFFTIIILVVCLVGYLAILAGNKWKLTRRMGLSLLLLYVVVIVLILLQSYDVIPNVVEVN